MGISKKFAGVALIALVPGGAWAKTYTCDVSTTTQCPALQGSYAAEPRAGSPNSMTYQNSAVALDLFDIQPEGADAFTPEGDSDTIGGAGTYYKAGYQTGERYDLHYQHARRIGEGTRARLIIDIPVSLNHADEFNVQYVLKGAPLGAPTANAGHSVVYGTVNVGVEFPVTPNWLVTPRVSYSNSQGGTYFGKDAELANASITTRYKIPQVGRGDLTIGGMIAYSHTIDTFLAKQPFYESADYWTLRGGLAYQLPLKTRMFGRQASIRASYVFTDMTGEPFMQYKQMHEIGINIGVRTREAEQKNGFEQLRAGVLYTHTINQYSSKANADAGTVTLGYRF